MKYIECESRECINNNNLHCKLKKIKIDKDIKCVQYEENPMIYVGLSSD